MRASQTWGGCGMNIGWMTAFLVLMVGLTSSTCDTDVPCERVQEKHAFLNVALDPHPSTHYMRSIEEEEDESAILVYYFVQDQIVRIDTCVLALSTGTCDRQEIVVFDNRNTVRIRLNDENGDGLHEEAVLYAPHGGVDDVLVDRDGDGEFNTVGCLADYEPPL